ncbi:MAG: RluA family pseudouridine synthase [Alphaproteobacteria bacterium]|nr:RluA family pseudouridine synthase [Alphaproteobacteria bacterium]
MPVEFKTVTETEKELRLDRWFKRHFPDIPHGLLEKLLRKKDIRINNTKATTNTRLMPGDIIRIPPIKIQQKVLSPKTLAKADISLMQEILLYKNEDILVLNKPAGLAVQGGSKTTHHIDGMLEALKFDYDEKPHLVHRLDKETSGVLVVARTAQSAAYYSRLFKTKEIHKTYWALVAGLPYPEKGKIEAPLLQKRTGKYSDTRTIDSDGLPAVSMYAVQDHLVDKISWLQMSPVTGRTHQLRIHAANILKTPILGDDRYGKKNELSKELPAKMFLHARAISIPLNNKKRLVIEAPLPKHFKQAFQRFGFSEKNVKSLFLGELT